MGLSDYNAMRRALKAMKKGSPHARTLGRMAKRRSQRILRNTLKRASVASGGYDLLHPRRAFDEALDRSTMGKIGSVARSIRQSSMRERFGEIGQEILGRQTADLLQGVGRYARGDSGSLLDDIGLGNYVKGIIQAVFGLRRNTGHVSNRELQKAIDIVKAAGYEFIRPDSPRAKAKTKKPYEPNIPSGPSRIGGEDVGGIGGMGGPSAPPPQSVAGTVLPRLPVGTLPADLYVAMHRVSSSNVYAIGYSGSTQTMRVQFIGTPVRSSGISGRGHRKGGLRAKSGGTLMNMRYGPGATYDYHGVPARVYDAIASSASKGTAIWDYLRVRGTTYGHQYDYELAAAAMVHVMSSVPAGGTPHRVARMTYVPRKAAARNMFTSRQIRQGNSVFRSVLPAGAQ